MPDAQTAHRDRDLSNHLYLGPGASNPSIEASRRRTIWFLRFAVVAVNSAAVLYWETVWKSANTQGEGVVARPTGDFGPDQVGATEDLILACHC
jgi:hypothetical protein